MKTNFFKKLIGITLSVFSITSFAQCPTVTGLSTTLGANGTATIATAVSGTVSPSTYFYWQVTPYNPSLPSVETFAQGEFWFPINGVYNVCFSFNDTITGCTSQSCTSVTITNVTSPSCNASFTSYTDSNCVTRFTNTSTGNNLTYGWTINGSYYTSTNPTVNLPNGNYTVLLQTYYASQPCDSVYQNITVGCSGTNTVSCQANYTFFTDSNCVLHLTNTSTGNNLTYEWYELTNNGNTATLFSTATNPTLTLGQGYAVIQLATFSNGTFCDSATNYTYINCGNPTTNCQANSYFIISMDSINPVPGQYQAYSFSSATGNASYLWDFGDGTTSSQQYPFHQYAIPGQYIVCLTVNGSYTSALGTATCTDTYCDSSSVHKTATGFLMGQLTVVPAAVVTGIKQAEAQSSFNVYPNPMADELTIEVSGIESDKLNYLFTNALGQIVLTGNTETTKTTINTSILEKGFYCLRLYNAQGKTIRTIKLIK